MKEQIKKGGVVLGLLLLLALGVFAAHPLIGTWKLQTDFFGKIRTEQIKIVYVGPYARVRGYVLDDSLTVLDGYYHDSVCYLTKRAVKGTGTITAWIFPFSGKDKQGRALVTETMGSDRSLVLISTWHPLVVVKGPS